MLRIVWGSSQSGWRELEMRSGKKSEQGPDPNLEWDACLSKGTECNMGTGIGDCGRGEKLSGVKLRNFSESSFDFWLFCSIPKKNQ